MVRRRSFFGAIAVTALLTLTAGATTLSSAFGATTSPTDVGILASTAGCGKTPTLTSGTHSMQINGKNRTYILKVPDNYDKSHPYRLIFGLHWLGGNATDVANGQTVQPYYGLQRLANNSAIFVAPQGLSEAMGTGWANTGGQDLAFVDEMVKRIEEALCVDTTQLFSLGFSFGGGMSYAIACARAKVFRAVAIYSGGVISGCSGGTEPIAYLQAHGIGDNVLPISGARTMRDKFAKNNGCTAQNAPEPAAGSGTHTTFAYSGCSAGRPTVWYAFDGGHTPVPTDRNGSQWLPGETWKFFTQFQTTTPPSSTPPTSTPPSAPPTSTPPTSMPPTSPPGSAACRIGYSVNSWDSSLTASITITNTGGTTINGWSLSFTLPAGQAITSGWNATYSPASGAVTARNVSYNGTLPAGGSTSVGFQATHTGNTARPTSFALNGSPCALA